MTETTTSPAQTSGEFSKFRLLKFESGTCAACQAMTRAKTLERVCEDFPGLTFKVIAVEDGEGEEVKEAAKVADKYDVEAFPTIILEGQGVGEIIRFEEAVSYRDLRKYLKEQFDNAANNAVPW